MSYDPAAWQRASLPPGLGGSPGSRKPDVPLPPIASYDPEGPRPVPARDSLEGIAIPHQEQFAALYLAGFRKYWSRFDEALRDNWENALVMRRDAFTEELISLRTFPVVSLTWDLVPDDPEHPQQVAIADRLTRLVDSIPHYQDMKLWLKEDVFYGKSAVQVIWKKMRIDGHTGVTVSYWEPVSGDSLVFDWDGAVGVLVRAGWNSPAAENGALVEQADRGRVLMLRDDYWRDRFIISKFRRSGADYMYEGDLAGSMHGKGLRSRTYYAWLLRQNYLAWRQNAAQRFPINGTLVGYYPQGNLDFRNEIFQALKLMSVNNISAFPKDANHPDTKWFERLDAPTSGYEQFGEIIHEIESCIRRCWLGQEISSVAKPMGLGSGATMHAQQDTAEAYLRFDANSLDETLTTDLIKVMIKLNTFIYEGKTYGPGETLPFEVRVRSKIDKKDVGERAQAVDTAAKVGLELSKRQLYTDLGLSPPDKPDDAVGGQPIGPNGQGTAPGSSDAPGQQLPVQGNPGENPLMANGEGQPPTNGHAGPKPFQIGAGADGEAKLLAKSGVNLRGGKPQEPPTPKLRLKAKSPQQPGRTLALSPGQNGKVRLTPR